VTASRASNSTRSTATCGTPICRPSARAALRLPVHGPWDPAAGHRCDPSKLLLDPYGKSFHGDIEFSQAVYSYDLHADDLATGGTPPMIDSLGHTMTSVVINPYFDWGYDRRPARPITRRSSTRRTSRA
jgi:glycogen operon protein